MVAAHNSQLFLSFFLSFSQTNRLHQEYKIGKSGSSSKSSVFVEYLAMCAANHLRPLFSATCFGKLVKRAFPEVQTQRKGPRGNSKQHYALLKKINKNNNNNNVIINSSHINIIKSHHHHLLGQAGAAVVTQSCWDRPVSELFDSYFGNQSYGGDDSSCSSSSGGSSPLLSSTDDLSDCGVEQACSSPPTSSPPTATTPSSTSLVVEDSNASYLFWSDWIINCLAESIELQPL